MHGSLSNLSTAIDCKDFSPWSRLVAVIEKLFPRKTASNLAEISGLKERAAYSFLAAKSPLSSDAIISMLKTPHGADVLCALMGDCREPWYLEFRIKWEKEQKLREIEAWERDLRGIDNDYAKTDAARRHGMDGAVRQVGPRQAVRPT